MDGTELAGPAIAPVTRSDRVDALDIMRGIAVFGILLMNITAFGLVLPAYFNPLVDGYGGPIDLQVYEVVTILFEGTMRGIFSMLFGAGIVLLTTRMEEKGAGIMAAEIHFRRMLWMMAFGIIHWALLLWLGEILFAYSLCGLVLFAPRKLSPKMQIAIAAVLLLLALGDGFYAYSETSGQYDEYVAATEAKTAGAALTDGQIAAIANWDEQVGDAFPDEATKDWFTRLHTGTYWHAVTAGFDLSYDFQWGGFPHYFFYDMMPFMLIGMALLKLGVLTGEATKRTYAVMLVVGYGIGIPLGIYEVDLQVSGEFSPLANAAADRTYQLSRLAMVLGHVGLFLLVIKAGVLKWLQRGLAAAGRMALSNYVMQTIICTWLFYSFGPGLGLYLHFDRHELYYVVFAICAAEIVWSVIWLKYYRFGPFEWLWRSLTYWKLQPMKVARGADTPPPAQALGAI